MPIHYERFGTTDLSTLYETEEYIGTGKIREAYLPLSSGGALDLLGGERAPRDATPVQLKGELLATTATALQTAYYLLRARSRQRDKLYRRRADGQIEWAWARLGELPDVRIPEHVLFLPVTLNFTTISAYWKGAHHGGWVLDSGILLDTGYYLDEATGYVFTLTGSGATTCVVTNGGHTPVQDTILALTAGTATITAVTLLCVAQGVEWTWTGTLLSGKTLVVDTGALSVRNDGADAYSGLAFTSNQTIDDWLRLGAGANTLKVTLAGGAVGSLLVVEFSDAWE